MAENKPHNCTQYGSEKMKNNDSQRVAVLMATFNGEKYIAEQLDSLLAQEFRNFELYISDDGSTDRTVDILRSYSGRFSGRMHILEQRSRSNNGGAANPACENFLYLLENVQSDLYLFCDQDDWWLENHIQLLVEKYNSLAINEVHFPVLVRTDLSIADSQLNILHCSDSAYMKRRNNPSPHTCFISTDGIRGCTCMINNALKLLVFKNREMLYQNIEKIEMHDIFTAHIAVFFGKMYFIDVPTLLYRQHGNNTSGGIGKKRTLKEMLNKGISFSRYKKSYKTLKSELAQKQSYAEFFISYFENQFSEKEMRVMQEFIGLSKRHKLSRIYFLLKNHFFKKGFINNIWQCIVA